MIVHALIFFVVALLYASAGFGGGSTYLALLAWSGVPYEIFPILALSCNLIVTAGGCYHFIKQKQINWRLTLPFVAASVPCAYFAGTIPVQRENFFLILGIALALSGIRLLIPSRSANNAEERTPQWTHSLPIGAALGTLAGIVGIGGGIFLAPIMHFMNWGNARSIAATTSFFILVNSIAGLAGQLVKSTPFNDLVFPNAYYLLFIAVFLGGQIGSRAASQWFSHRAIKSITGLLILYVGARILLNL